MKAVGVCAILSVLLTGCASKFVVQSNPSEADVFINSPNVSERAALGKTPVNTTVKEISAKTGINATSGDFVEVTVEKKGFKSEKILVPASRLLTFLTSINVVMKPEPTDGDKAAYLVQLILNAQKYAQKHDFELAIAEINKAISADDKFVRAYAVKGAIYYLRRDYPESLKWYEQVLAMNPQDDEALKMVVEIRKLTNKTQ